MELLHLLGTDEQKERWLEPLLDGTIRSAFAMTEPDVASSDATNIATRIERDGDEYVINGRKWWTSGAMDPRCRAADPDGQDRPGRRAAPAAVDGARAARHPRGHGRARPPGLRPPRPARPRGGARSRTCGCRSANVLGEEGGGFAAAQARLGPGRIHHCMRALGAAERALAMMVERAQDRVAFGGPLADQGVVRQQIAESRLEIEQARLLCHRACARHRHRGQQGRPAPGRDGQGRRPPGRHRGHRPGHPGARRRRHHRRHPAARRCTPGTARCACSTDPTRCTCARSPGPS